MKMRYDAFISYSHAADGRLAPSLQSALHKLAKPWYKIRALTVFRDETDLSVSPGTWPSIEKALSEAKHFVLLASPGAARSKWVRREVAFWLKERSIETISIVLTDGNLIWDDETGRMDSELTTAIPPELVAAYREEPLYGDLRFARTEADLSLQNTEFKRRVVPIAAKLHGKTPAELVSDEVREHRRTLRIRNSAITALVVLSILAVSGAFVATRQAAEAERQRRSAVAAREVSERERLRAQSGELRALIQRIDVMIGRFDPDAEAPRIKQLRTERAKLESSLNEVARAHQQKLAATIGFRGDLGFLLRWEGHAGELRLKGVSVQIDPATDLATANPETIRDRYAFILTPDELEAVLSLVGLRGAAVKTAWKANPILQRIRLAPTDVARLVPEVAAPVWQKLVSRFPSLGADATPGNVQTALLSLAFNLGAGNRVWETLSEPILRSDWAAAADVVASIARQGPHTRYPGLERRRDEEAALLRAAQKTDAGLSPGGENNRSSLFRVLNSASIGTRPKKHTPVAKLAGTGQELCPCGCPPYICIFGSLNYPQVTYTLRMRSS
ncbi:MAG: TIR domain-containing protein [Desulfobacteraceae bacterium]|nr:TIR domain-containing protein [Desulfobacteraceae bacterium]